VSEQQASFKLGLIVGIAFEKLPDWDTGRPISPEWALTLAHIQYPTGLNHSVMAVQGKRIDDARNEIIEKAIELDVKTVFFLDDDVVIPVNALLHLYPTLFSEPKVIAAAGIYPPKRKPTEPMVYRRMCDGPAYDMKFGEVFDVEGAATGCMLVRTEFFKNIEKPWFKTVKEAGQDGGRIYSKSMTDDLYFCQKAIRAGYKVKANASILCKHIDAIEHKAYDLSQYLPPKKPAASPSLGES